MGLPVWRCPVPEAQNAHKPDIAAAAARSSIRRASSRPRVSRRVFDNSFLAAAQAESQRALRTPALPEPTRRLPSYAAYLPPPPVPDPRNYARPSDTGARTFRPLPAYTPNFAPAAVARSARPALPPSTLSAASDNAVGVPPLRRVGHRTIVDGPLPTSSLRESWSPAMTLDGLGDRDRSLSPADEQWDTFLTTLRPDPLPPTADSSFTSAAASASFTDSEPASRAGSSNSNSGASSRTHLTVPSRRASPPASELFMIACDTSDSDTASDTEAEEELELRAFRHRLRDQRDPEADPPRLGRRTDSHRHRQIESPLSDVDEEQQGLDQEMHNARAILERLAQREDITDEFWASVGLTRSMADRVERIQQRGDP